MQKQDNHSTRRKLSKPLKPLTLSRSGSVLICSEPALSVERRRGGIKGESTNPVLIRFWLFRFKIGRRNLENLFQKTCFEVAGV